MVVIVLFFVAAFIVVRVVAILANVIKASGRGECCRSRSNIHGTNSIAVKLVQSDAARASICSCAQVGNH